MKKGISLFCAFLLLCSLVILPGCTQDEEEEIENYLNEHYAQIQEKLESAEDSAAVMHLLLDWAAENDIRASYDESCNVILSAKATAGFEDAPSTILQCTVDLEEPEHTALSMTVATYLLKECTSHGFLRVLFTAAPDGIESLRASYLIADRFISLDWQKANEMLVGGAGSIYYTMTHTLEWTQPSYTTAYEISVAGPASISYVDAHHHPNPITVIGDLLAQAKSSGILLEIAAFNGGDSADTFPPTVSCTILVNQNDVPKIVKRLQEAKEDFEARYSDDDDAVYSFSFHETAVPDKVIAYEDAAKLVSFLYTCISGTYLKDDAGEVIAVSNIGSIGTASGLLDIRICAASKSSAVLTEMDSVFDTVCGLCGISYTKEAALPVWENASTVGSPLYSESDTLKNGDQFPDNSLIHGLDAALDEFGGKKTAKVRCFEKTACSVTASRVSGEMSIVALGITEKTLLQCAEALQSFLGNAAADAAETAES